ncbi:MAG: NADH-ubiquinone oxidoreductase-F iron-sulfur binding region domain-containing protein, partial [Burkholderiaceae bacterium]
PPVASGGNEGGHRRDLLIEHLHALNDAHHGLPEALLVALAAEMAIPVAEVFEVASFYHHFEVLRDGEAGPGLTVRVCDGLSCQLAGASPLLAELQQRLPALLGRADVRVEAAPCVGRCDQAPAVQVGQWPLGHATPATVAAVGAQAPENFEQNWHLPIDCIDFVATDSIGLEAYQSTGGYALARQVASGERDAESVIQALEHAGLRGLGGAGFPAGRKWRIVRGQPAPRLMAVNIDEGEPGTFKDRWYLERDPHRFLEGLLVAAQVVGCNAVYIYLRDEYHHALRLLTQALADLRANPPCELPQIELRRGAGAYICGEESAMIESIEGKRGEPRLRPPYIAEVGLFGRPTLEHNFETLYWVRDIVQKGGDWFASHGRHGRTGLRSFSVSGRVKQPGVKLAPAGITLRELIDEFCGGMADGHTLYAYLPGGASGGILPARLADVPLDFDTLQPHGSFIGSAAVVVLSQADRARDAALNAMQFFAHESCGQCTPCRVGTAKAAALMQADTWDADILKDLASVMVDASICGLGQAAPNPLQSVLTYFPHEVSA